MPRIQNILILATSLLLLVIQANAEAEAVQGYFHLGRGSCQDGRGKMYSYLQRSVKFPNAETCGRQECERFGNSEIYRGFEYSVAQRCTCLFDYDQIPVVPSAEGDPVYVSKADVGIGAVGAVSGTPGTDCYRFGRNSAMNTRSMGGFYAASLFASATIYTML